MGSQMHQGHDPQLGIGTVTTGAAGWTVKGCAVLFAIRDGEGTAIHSEEMQTLKLQGFGGESVRDGGLFLEGYR